MKRGQTQQIFVWILVLVVAVSILFFGIKLIKKSEGLKDEVLIMDFFNKLEKKLSQYYYLDSGSSGEEKFSLPSDVKEVCFIDPTTISDNPNENKIHYFFKLKDFSNVFLWPSGVYQNNRFKLNTLIFLENNPECFNIVNGALMINLYNEGVGKGVKITQ